MRYRPHIDGLRAVAIVPVVLMHAGVAMFSGGFTGVDVFFVISGFLISSLIVEEIGQGRFTLGGFYKRRALRILPAYLVMLAAVLATSWFTLFPTETRALGQSVTAASLFVSNIHFLRSAGYFDPALEDSLLLHTWTLSVEEQFYLLLPVFLILVARLFSSRWALALLAVSLASFTVNLWGVTRYEAATFFSLPTRAWEFGLGALAAVTGLVSLGGARTRGLGAAAGAALIAWGVFGLSEDSAFPGASAIFPALGAMLLIAFAEGNLAGRVLGSAPVVVVGRISYSLYLWHWPIIVFWKMQMRPVLRPWDVAVIVALSLVAAALSYRFVEEPFRRPELRRRPAIQVNGTALASLAMAAFVGGVLVFEAEDWGRDYPPELDRIASYVDYGSDRQIHPCLIHALAGGAGAFDPEICLASGPGSPTLLVLGDSHAEHLVSAIEEAYPGTNVQFAGGTGCRPTVDLVGDWYCPAVLRPVIHEHIPRGGVDVLLVSARWTAGDIEPLRRSVDHFLRYVDEVLIIGPTPEYLDTFPMILARGMRLGRNDPERLLDPAVRDLDRRMAAMDWGGARYVSMYDLICPGACRHLTQDGVPYHWDYGHFTMAAAREVVADLGSKVLPPR